MTQSALVLQLYRTIQFHCAPFNQQPRAMRTARLQGRQLAALVMACGLALCATSANAIPTASLGYSISTLSTGGNAYGDVVAVGDYLFVGVGSFGSNSIVRIAPGGSTTTIATGFSSLSGFAYDAVNDRLIVGDNFNDGVTGDTIYSLSNPVGFAGTPATAASLELLPFGSIPGIADIAMDLSDPTGMTILITDATEDFPPLNGALLKLAVATSTLSTVFQVGSGWFAAGVAASSNTVFVGDSIFGTGGRIHTTSLPLPGGAPTLDFLVDGPGYLNGQYDLELDGDGMLLSTSVDELVRIDPDTGDQTVLATGFEFATGLAVADDGAIFLIDGISLYKLTAVPEPGTALLVGLGLVAIAGVNRRSRLRVS